MHGFHGIGTAAIVCFETAIIQMYGGIDLLAVPIDIADTFAIGTRLFLRLFCSPF